MVGDLNGPTGATGATGALEIGAPLFDVDATGSTVPIKHGDTLTFKSSTLDISAESDPATVSIESPGNLVHFNSLSKSSRVQSFADKRSSVIAVGLGFESIIAVNDPIPVLLPASSIKLPAGGIVTELHVFLSLALTASDTAVSTVFAQLYTATPMREKSFYPVPNTQVEILIPYGSAAGTTFEMSLTGLSQVIKPDSQLMLVFWNTSTGGLGYAGIEGIMSGVIKVK